MSALNTALQEAVSEDIISAEQCRRLTFHLTERGLLEPASQGSPAASGPFAELSAPRADEPVQQVEESEAPRLIRGFHDILITIGILAALAGVWGLSTATVALVATWVLAEIFVARLRLALPAFVLTIACVVTSLATTAEWVVPPDGPESGTGYLLMLSFSTGVMLAAFYWRYRIPVALASLILALGGIAMLVVLSLIEAAAGVENAFEAMPLAVLVTMFVFSVLLFAAAMRFDMRDPRRVTRRSDVAFWLHLGAAPALLYSALAILLFDGGTEFWWLRDPHLGDALIVLAVIALFMLVGIVIDRRAFVTSGLVSLGAAIVAVINETDIELAQVAALPVLLVGLIVLTLGTGWPHLRRVVVRRLPEAVRSRVPPA